MLRLAVSLVFIMASCLLLIGGLASVLRVMLQRGFSATTSALSQDPHPLGSKRHRYGIATVMPSRTATVSAGNAKRRLPS